MCPRHNNRKNFRVIRKQIILSRNRLKKRQSKKNREIKKRKGE